MPSPALCQIPETTQEHHAHVIATVQPKPNNQKRPADARPCQNPSTLTGHAPYFAETRSVSAQRIQNTGGPGELGECVDQKETHITCRTSSVRTRFPRSYLARLAHVHSGATRGTSHPKRPHSMLSTPVPRQERRHGAVKSNASSQKTHRPQNVINPSVCRRKRVRRSVGVDAESTYYKQGSRTGSRGRGRGTGNCCGSCTRARDINE